MSLIKVSNLTFGYDGSADNIFENACFQIDTDWKLGFTGRNGRGKTTFLKLLQGCYEYRGTISASVDFEYFPYSADPEALTEDVILRTAPHAESWEIYRELSMLDVSDDALYRQFKTLSNGERTKVMLAAMFLRENAFLLIDEPTNHLDAEGRRKTAEYLKRKKGFILVSHDRDFLDLCTDHILSINKHTIEIRRGSFSAWLRDKELRDSFEAGENEKLRKEIKHLEKASRRAAEWSEKAESRKIGFDPAKTEKSLNRRAYEGAKSKKAMSRSKAIEKRQKSYIEEKSKLLKDLETAEDLKITPLKYHSNKLLQLENVCIFYDGRAVCRDVSFTVEQGQAVSLRGANGCGKSSILKLICGADIKHSGRIIRNGSLKISYVPQSSEHLSGSLDDYAENLGIDRSLFKAVLRKLDFSRGQFDQPIERYSGGQKKKVLIAGSLCQQAHLYIWDEPLNYIDVLSRIQIENLLAEYRPAILFVEHDAAFCRKIAGKTVDIVKA
ncbi:ribosomal protection-like ABC-F family protein [Ruminococcus sp. Marseille-P6503]|uniref:ribosomal protection-like ABC-F family protein n=1 Tax=Ruminococcus sp. Marseille-P6503 TaxID=2364796 RepID=UPI000F5201F2|nr:ABC-F type ribosomal protection protein [Ruminococcus sp. Marseille-P6503]